MSLTLIYTFTRHVDSGDLSFTFLDFVQSEKCISLAIIFVLNSEQSKNDKIVICSTVVCFFFW